MSKKIKGCTSLVLSTLGMGASVASQQTANAAWYDFLWYLMPASWWNYLFENSKKTDMVSVVKKLDSSQEKNKTAKVLAEKKSEVNNVDAFSSHGRNEFKNKIGDQNEKCENGNAGKKEKFIVNDETLSAKKTEVVNILNQLDTEVNQRRFADVNRFYGGVLPKGLVLLRDFMLPFFDKNKKFGKCSHLSFASVSVGNKKVRFYRYIGYLNDDTREYDVDESKLKENIFEEISLEDADCVEKVKHLANKISKINDLFLSLYDICKDLEVAPPTSDLEKKVISINLCKNELKRSCFVECKNGPKCCINKIVIDGLKNEKIRVFYSAIGKNDIKEVEYNIVKDEDLQALATIFPRGDVENVDYEKENIKEVVSE